jgi:hypothetical protein
MSIIMMTSEDIFTYLPLQKSQYGELASKIKAEPSCVKLIVLLVVDC